MAEDKESVRFFKENARKILFLFRFRFRMRLKAKQKKKKISRWTDLEKISRRLFINREYFIVTTRIRLALKGEKKVRRRE